MKKVKIFIIILLFIISIPIHYIYKWFPNIVTSIFFPVNESIFEHMKIIYTSIVIVSILEYFIYKNSTIKVNNFILSIPIVSIIGITFYLIIYIILNNFIKHNIIISISLLYIIFIICEILSYYILKSKAINKSCIIGIFLITISYISFTYLTYYPPKNYLFLDNKTNTYGIKKM